MNEHSGTVILLCESTCFTYQEVLAIDLQQEKKLNAITEQPPIYRPQKNENLILKRTSNQYNTMVWCNFLVFFMCKITAVKQTVCLLALEMHVLPHAVTSSGTFSPPAHMDCPN